MEHLHQERFSDHHAFLEVPPQEFVERLHTVLNNVTSACRDPGARQALKTAVPPGRGSGLDLAREIALPTLGVPMVLTGGYGGGMTQPLAAANLPFPRKPYRLEALRQAVDRAVPPTEPALDAEG